LGTLWPVFRAGKYRICTGAIESPDQSPEVEDIGITELPRIIVMWWMGAPAASECAKIGPLMIHPPWALTATRSQLLKFSAIMRVLYLFQGEKEILLP
jgi:hypothetical protein